MTELYQFSSLQEAQRVFLNAARMLFHEGKKRSGEHWYTLFPRASVEYKVGDKRIHVWYPNRVQRTFPRPFLAHARIDILDKPQRTGNGYIEHYKAFEFDFWRSDFRQINGMNRYDAQFMPDRHTLMGTAVWDAKTPDEARRYHDIEEQLAHNFGSEDVAAFLSEVRRLVAQ